MILFLCVNMYSLSAYSVPVTVIDIGDATVNIKDTNVLWYRDFWSHHFMANRWGRVETMTDFIFLGYKIIADGDCSHEIKDACSLKEKL